MADVGLDASLELDIAAALRQVDALERRLDEATQVTLRADASQITRAIDAAIAAAVDEVEIAANAGDITGSIDSAVNAAASDITVDADVSSITGRIDAAVDRADDGVTIQADASGITGEIDSAVDAADTGVTVTGEAPGVTGAINAAVDAADTTVSVDADPGSLQATASAADELDTALIASAASGRGLTAVLGSLGAAGAAAGLYSLVAAASDLEQSVGGTTAIFGEAQTSVVGFARNAAEAAGLTEESARTLTSQLGGLLQGFGFTQDQAAELSITLAQLGADLSATFGGSTQEAVQALGAALRGETDPIERYGISLNAARVEAKAMELGLAATKEELDANAKAQAALAVITEQSANAQGQFAREAETTAGQLERAKAEAGNMAAAVGQELQPAMNELLAMARSDLIPALGELGEALGPALADVALALAPAFGTTVDLLAAATPIVQLFADAIALVPDPMIAFAGALLTLGRVTKPFRSDLKGAGDEVLSFSGKFRQARANGAGFGESLGAMVGGLTPLTVGLTVAATAFTLYSAEQQKVKERQADIAADQKTFTTALSESTSSVRGITDALTQMVRAGENLTFFEDIIPRGLDITADQVFSRAGVSVEQFAEAVGSTGRDMERLLRSVDDPTLRGALRELANEMDEAARSSIMAGIAVGDFTQEQADVALGATRNADGTKNYAAALDELEVASKDAAEQQDTLAKAVGGVDSEGATHQVTALGLRLSDLRGPLEGLDTRFAAFAVAADQAGLSGAELEAVASDLGVSADQLGPAIDEVVAPINDMAAAAASATPELSSLADPIEEFTVEGFRDDLQEAYEALVNFRENLAILGEFNPELVRIATELGPEYTQALVDGLREGNPQILNEIALLSRGIEEEEQRRVDDVVNVHGPAMVEAMGLVGQSMTEAFGRTLDLVTPASESIRAIEGTVEFEGPGFIGAMNAIAQQATAGFNDNLNPDAGAKIRAVDAQVAEAKPSWLLRVLDFAQGGDDAFRVGFSPDPRPGLLNADQQVQGRQQSWLMRLAIFGGQGRSGFRAGISGVGSDAAGAMDSAIGQVSGRGDEAYSGAYSVGTSLGSGLIDGMAAMLGRVQSQAVSIVQGALAAARREAGISSPSKVWRDELGLPMVEGLADGLEQVEKAEKASVSLVESALLSAQSAVDSVAPIALDPAVTAAFSGVGAGGTVVNVGSGAVVINVPPGSTPAQAQALGTAAAKGFTTALAKRQVGATARLSGSRGGR